VEPERGHQAHVRSINGVDSSAGGIGSPSILLSLGVVLAAQRFTTLARVQQVAAR
jgi:hypothetical protein